LSVNSPTASSSTRLAVARAASALAVIRYGRLPACTSPSFMSPMVTLNTNGVKQRGPARLARRTLIGLRRYRRGGEGLCAPECSSAQSDSPSGGAPDDRVGRNGEARRSARAAVPLRPERASRARPRRRSQTGEAAAGGHGARSRRRFNSQRATSGPPNHAMTKATARSARVVRFRPPTRNPRQSPTTHTALPTRAACHVVTLAKSWPGARVCLDAPLMS
jgi:hypothetical protein